MSRLRKAVVVGLVALPVVAGGFVFQERSSVAGSRLFDQVFAMTAGGPGNATQTLSTMIYKQAFALGSFSYSATLAVVLTLIVVLLASVQFRALVPRALGVRPGFQALPANVRQHRHCHR